MIMNFDFISKRLSSNSFSEQIRLPNFVLSIFRNLCFTIRQDGTCYSYLSKEIADLPSLKKRCKSLAAEIKDGRLKELLLNSGEFSELESETICRNAVAQLTWLSKASDHDEVIHICLRNLNELGKYKIISDTTDQAVDQFSKICRNVLNTAEETRPLGARAYRKFRNAIICSSTEIHYSTLLLSDLFIRDVSLYIPSLE